MKIPRPRINYIEAAFDYSHKSWCPILLSGEQTWSLRILAPDMSNESPAKAALVVSQDAIIAQIQDRLAHELSPWLFGEGDLDVAVVEDSAILSGRAAGHRIPKVKPTVSSPVNPTSPPTKIFLHLNVPNPIPAQVEMLVAFIRGLLGANLISSEKVAFIAGYLTGALEDDFLSRPTTDAAGQPNLAGAAADAQAYRATVSLLFETFAASGGGIGAHRDRTVAQMHELLALSDPELYVMLTEARYPGHGDTGGRRPPPPYSQADLINALSYLIAGNFLEQVFLYTGLAKGSNVTFSGWLLAPEILARDPKFDLANAKTQFRRTERWRHGRLAFNAMRLAGLF